MKAFQTEKQCMHENIKKNYRHGRKSSATMFCKDCDEVVTPIKLKQLSKTKRPKKKNGN